MFSDYCHNLQTYMILKHHSPVLGIKEELHGSQHTKEPHKAVSKGNKVKHY